MTSTPHRSTDGLTANAALAILVSGGLDSAILLGEALGHHLAVHPLYIRTGLVWEATELRQLRRVLEAVHGPTLRPLQVLDLPVTDLYGEHWSLTGRNVPDAESADEAVFLPGRNVLLLAKAMLWCHLHEVPALALGVLAANPFPDATDSFFAAYQSVVNQAVGGRVKVYRPYAGLDKAEVMQRGRGLPLELTFSCIRPTGGRHCGRCNKCAERRRAFAAAGMRDPTAYGTEEACTA
jgi:7-cyano-7-deazaguanine synthase